MINMKTKQKLTIFPNLHDKGIRRLLQERDNVLIERVHVLHQPL